MRVKVSRCVLRLRKNGSEANGEEGLGTCAGLKQGDSVEAKYGESWFEASVLALSEGKVKIKWAHDGSEEELESEKVRVKGEEVPEAPAQPLVVDVGLLW